MRIQQLGPADLPALGALITLFGEAFGDPETYGVPPPAAYLARLLVKPHIIVLAALAEGEVCGGLIAYELEKLEQARSELYIYDLAVAPAQRRQGIATELIRQLVSIASERGAWVVFVQADHADPLAIALYEKLGTREDVLHFDIAVEDR